MSFTDFIQTAFAIFFNKFFRRDFNLGCAAFWEYNSVGVSHYFHFLDKGCTCKDGGCSDSYIALGACGVPVFAGFTGGAYKLVALTGGFVWGFLPLVALCGAAGSDMKRPSSLLLALLGLAVCHMIGVGQFALVTGNPLGASALAVSVPYIAKDVLSVLLAAAVVRAAGQRLRPSSAAAGRAVQGQIGHLS